MTRELVGANRRFEGLYNWLSHLYDSDFLIARSFRKRFWPSGEAAARREVIERLEVKSDSRVLETGIGTGGNLPYLRKLAPGVEVYGLDTSIGMLRQCARNLEKWKLQAELFLGNAEALPFKDECFDVVFHLGGINFFTQKRKAIEEMVRVARPGTRIVIADETERLIGKELGRITASLLFGRQLAKEILSFHSEDMFKMVPGGMSEVRFDYIWEGNGYRLEFRKPLKGAYVCRPNP